MEAFFLVCAVLGGTVLVAQFLLGLIGFGHGELGDDLSGDGSFDAGHFGGDHFGSHFGGHGDGASGDSSAGSHEAATHGTSSTSNTPPVAHEHAAANFFKVLSIRTVVAALVFFGLAGLAAQEAKLDTPLPLLIALATGAAAMYGVYYLMQSLSRLRADGTVRIEFAIGHEGTVYLSIPADNQGRGKVHLTLQNRLVEYSAKTAGPALPTGTRIAVIDIVEPGTVEVAAIGPEAAAAGASAPGMNRPKV